MPLFSCGWKLLRYGHQKRSRNDSLTQINREESFTSVSSYIQPKLVQKEGKTKPSSNNTKIALSSYKTQRKIKYDMTRETLNVSLGALVYAFQNWRSRVHSRNNFFAQNLIIDCIKNTWTITRMIALHKIFFIFCGHFLNTYPLDSNLAFGQPRPEILHTASVVF